MYGSSYNGGGEKCAHSNHYDTKNEAKQAARRMGMEGCHTMSCHGKTVYMPGQSHGDYMDRKDGGTNGSPVDPSAFGF